MASPPDVNLEEDGSENESEDEDIDQLLLAAFAQHQQHTPTASLVTPPNTNLFVNYLPSHVDDEMLRNMFAPFGQVISAKVMRKLDSGESKCYGFVKFATLAQGAAAIQDMHQKSMGRKVLSVQYAESPGSETYRFGTPNTTLYVKNLPRNLKKHTIMAVFKPFGELKQVNMVKDMRGAFIGIVFVTYNTITEAATAVQALNGFDFDGRWAKIVVRFADTESEKMHRQRKRHRRAMLQQQRDTGPPLGAEAAPQPLPSSILNELGILSPEVDELTAQMPNLSLAHQAYYAHVDPAQHPGAYIQDFSGQGGPAAGPGGAPPPAGAGGVPVGMVPPQMHHMGGPGPHRMAPTPQMMLAAYHAAAAAGHLVPPPQMMHPAAAAAAHAHAQAVAQAQARHQAQLQQQQQQQQQAPPQPVQPAPAAAAAGEGEGATTTSTGGGAVPNGRP